MERASYINRVNDLFKTHSSVALLGPRQCGKTTLAKMYAKQNKDEPTTLFDLEDPVDLVRLENPMLALEPLKGLIIIDEIQRRPDLFPVLRVLIDKANKKQRYLILGSASRDLIKQSSETLAGRIGYVELTPFTLNEVKPMKKLWVCGGFPRAFLAENEELSFQWLKNYTSTFLERDIPNLGFKINSNLLRRFWMMLTHYHGNTLNMSDLGKSLGVSHTSIRSYIDILVGTFMIRELQPWFVNINKRQVKTPKIYFKDSGIFHYLLGVHSEDNLLSHPKLGASWEGFALEEIIRFYDAAPEECFFWGIHEQAELDLLIVKDGKKMGFEFKYQDAPRMTKSITQSMETLKLESLDVIYPGSKEYALGTNIMVKSLSSFGK